MSWSVVGLYSAFWAEVGTRFVGNMQQFWWMVALASGLTAFVGSIIIKREAKNQIEFTRNLISVFITEYLTP